MTDIYENGSVTASFSVYEDFCNYEKGIYQHVTGDFEGEHDVKIVGWGVDDVNYYFYF